MKKLFIGFFCIFICSFVFSESMDGFWGIKFGDSKEKVKQVMNEKKCIVIKEEGDFIIFTGVFTEQNVKINFTFFKNQFYTVSVQYPHDKNMAISKWQENMSLLEQKYGEPDKKIRKFISPYMDGDGFEEQAILNNKGILVGQWNFDGGDTISCFIYNDLDTYIMYSDAQINELHNIFIQQNKMNDL